jgi:3-oxoacyl-[acyl-carrier protein] reductase
VETRTRKYHQYRFGSRGFRNANQINYSSSKAGIIGFTKSAAKEFGIRNIRVNALAPGFIITEMTDSCLKKFVKHGKQQYL